MKSIERTQTIVFTPTAKEVFEFFWSMDAHEQAAFFNRLGDVENLPMQLEYVRQSPFMMRDGRRAMELIGEYSKRD